MKKVFGLVILALCVGFTSCNGDDDPTNDGNIVGKWQLYSISPSVGNEDCDFEGWMEIKDDGTCVFFDKCEETTETGTWEKDGNTLTLVSDPPIVMTAIYTIISISETELVMERDYVLKWTEKYRRL